MKRLFSALLVSVFSMMVQAAPIVIPAPVDHIFVPKGFDNNDNVEVMVSGKFPNSCYSRHKVETFVNRDVINVRISALLVRNENKVCEAVEVPFLENVTIGNLQAGSYKIVVNQTLRDGLKVEEAKSNSVDDHLYALVDYVELGFTGGASGDAMLIGRKADCLAFDRLEYLSNNKDTLSILPIMKKVSQVCSSQRSQFAIPVKFNPRTFRHDKVLLFVRTMDGKSVSAIVE